MSDHRKVIAQFLTFGKFSFSVQKLLELPWVFSDLTIADGVTVSVIDRFLVFEDNQGHYLVFDRRSRDRSSVTQEDRDDYHNVGETAFRR